MPGKDALCQRRHRKFSGSGVHCCEILLPWQIQPSKRRKFYEKRELRKTPDPLASQQSIPNPPFKIIRHAAEGSHTRRPFRDVQKSQPINPSTQKTRKNIDGMNEGIQPDCLIDSILLQLRYEIASMKNNRKRNLMNTRLFRPMQPGSNELGQFSESGRRVVKSNNFQFRTDLSDLINVMTASIFDDRFLHNNERPLGISPTLTPNSGKRTSMENSLKFGSSHFQNLSLIKEKQNDPSIGQREKNETKCKAERMNFRLPIIRPTQIEYLIPVNKLS